MPTDVVMPQLGESVAEGTIVRWIKKVGEAVDKDEPLFEISTDKVDAEIPAPAAGTLVDIRVREGDTVAVNTVVAVIGGAGDVGTAGTTGASRESGTKSPRSEPTSSSVVHGAIETVGEPNRSRGPVVPAGAGVIARRRTRSSPVVRRIASEHSIDISRLTGSGISGRVTRRDIEGLVRQPRGPASRSVPADGSFCP